MNADLRRLPPASFAVQLLLVRGGRALDQNGIGFPRRWKRSMVRAILAARSRMKSRSLGKVKVRTWTEELWVLRGEWGEAGLAVERAEARAMQTVPTGLLALPPDGPAIPVMLMAKSLLASRRALAARAV